MTYRTADLYDHFADEIRIADPVFRLFGRRRVFGGPATTVKVFEDNVLVKKTLGEPGEGRVLVVDGGGSTRCALMGDLLADMAVTGGWAGVIIYGAIRDSAVIDAMDISVMALATCPAKSVKRGEGQTGIAVRFAGVDISNDHYVYGDDDGLVVASRELTIAP